jgi:hypothetical protein
MNEIDALLERAFRKQVQDESQTIIDVLKEHDRDLIGSMCFAWNKLRGLEISDENGKMVLSHPLDASILVAIAHLAGSFDKDLMSEKLPVLVSETDARSLNSDQ